MALSVSEVYYLSGETLRQVCLEQGLDDSGPVRELLQRLAEHIRSGPMDPPEVRQASATSDLGNNTGADIPPHCTEWLSWQWWGGGCPGVG